MTDKEYAQRLSQCASYTPQPAKYQDCMTFGPNCGGPVILEHPKKVIRPVYPFMNYQADISDSARSPYAVLLGNMHGSQCGSQCNCEPPVVSINPPTPPCTYLPHCTLSGKHLYPSKWTHQVRTNPMTVPVADSVEFYQTTMDQGPLTAHSEVCNAVYQNICDLSSGYQKCGPYIINRPSIGPR